MFQYSQIVYIKRIYILYIFYIMRSLFSTFYLMASYKLMLVFVAISVS